MIVGRGEIGLKSKSFSDSSLTFWGSTSHQRLIRSTAITTKCHDKKNEGTNKKMEMFHLKRRVQKLGGRTRQTIIKKGTNGCVFVYEL